MAIALTWNHWSPMSCGPNGLGQVGRAEGMITRTPTISDRQAVSIVTYVQALYNRNLQCTVWNKDTVGKVLYTHMPISVVQLATGAARLKATTGNPSCLYECSIMGGFQLCDGLLARFSCVPQCPS